MATALWSFKLDKDGRIRVAHVFFGDTDEEAQATLKAHADICPKFGPAFRNKETVEIPVELDDLPEGDEQAIGEWLDDWLDLEPDEEEEEGADVGGGEEDDEEG